MLGVGNEVEVCCVVVGDAKGFFKGLASIEGEPDVGYCGIDESEDTAAGEETFCTFLVGKLDGLDGNNEVAGDVGGEVKVDIIRDEARLVVATKGKGCINLL